ncbi:MAG: AMP-dependent synthetase and ligase, partial [Holophagaceae bacterium]|nr:AMP-dependent synthetase and ligase [Holophagaceae bacterium]
PHHHFYGLLFRILWPLGTGRPFATETCGDPDRYAAVLAGTSAPILISSPAHLTRLPELVDLDHFRTHPAAIFSSGGPLRREDALRWRRWVPRGILEIYGSTESGGVAWRNPSLEADSDPWTPFPDTQVSLEPDGAIHLRSPRLESGGMRMEDAAALRDDGRFQLLGRLDRVVKVEEKRVSLVELEAALEAHPAVDRAAVTLLEGHRRVLGAALVLAPGQEASGPEARLALSRLLRQHLGLRFDPAVLPRRWRFLAQLPFDDRGKLRTQDLAALFETREETQP